MTKRSLQNPRTTPTTHPATTEAAVTAGNPRNPRITLGADAEPVQFFYDLPCFVSTAFTNAADAVDYWVGQYTCDAAMDDATHRVSSAQAGGSGSQHDDLHLYLPSFEVHLSQNANLADAMREVLEHVVVEVNQMAEEDRGFYLAQLLTRWHSGGTIDWARFRLGNLLGSYFSMLPTASTCHGVEPGSYEVEPLIMWTSPHGSFIDVVDTFKPQECHIRAAVTRALDLGRARWGDDFLGVRYLPAEELTQSRLYWPDGGFLRLQGRDAFAIRPSADPTPMNLVSRAADPDAL